ALEAGLRNAADLVEAAQLHPEPVVLEQVKQQPEGRLVETVFAADARHVVDDGHPRERADEALVLEEIRRIDMKDESPAELLQHGQMLAQMLLAAGPVLHQMEAGAADAALSQDRKRPAVERGVDVRDAARRIAQLGDGVENDTVV